MLEPSCSPAPLDGTTTVTLKSGGVLRSIDRAQGPVAATVFPWEITVEPRTKVPDGSAQNRIDATITSASTIGGRVRLSLTGPDPLVAEVTTTAVEHLNLTPGDQVTATWRAAATRLVSNH